MAAYVVDHQQPPPPNNFKHYCKICKKGFGCGRALGGHMRAHGIGDDSALIDDDDPASDWEVDKIGSPDDNNNNAPPPPTNKRMYALRTNPNRLKSCRVCENCGKEFLSWKSFLEHGKCSSDGDAESLVSSPAASDGEDGGVPRSGGWLKRKRSFRSAKVGSFNPCPSSEEEDLANCLMMLSNATAADPSLAEPEESCASASKEEERRNNNNNYNTMSFVAPIACRIPIEKAKTVVGAANNNKSSASGLFECKACKKVFNSHQALGGHRASHKKVKGCFAARLDQADDDHDVITYEEFLPTNNNNNNKSSSSSAFQLEQSSSKRKGKVHECSICHRVFSSGQALGGHKRCHWITSNSAAETSSLAKFNQQFQEQIQQIQRRSKLAAADGSVPLNLKLDLNLPAPSDQVHKFPSAFGVPAEIFLLPWNINNIDQSKDKDCSENHSLEHKYRNEEKKTNSIHKDDHDNNNNDDNNNTNKCSSSTQNVEDEADSKVKLAKLSEQNGSASPWLQVGIGGSTSDTGADP